MPPIDNGASLTGSLVNATNSKRRGIPTDRITVRRTGHFRVFSEKFSATKTATNENFQEEPGNANARQRMTYADGQHAGCGERGIRTPGPVTRTQHFQCCTIGHSAISPATGIIAPGINND